MWGARVPFSVRNRKNPRDKILNVFSHLRFFFVNQDLKPSYIHLGETLHRICKEVLLKPRSKGENLRIVQEQREEIFQQPLVDGRR